MKISGRSFGQWVGYRAATLWCLLAVALVASTLPGPAAVAADPSRPSSSRASASWTQGQVACPTVLAPAELVPPATMQGLRPDGCRSV